jgi:hypothetical protein
MLEGALRNDPDVRRRILNEFDLRSGAYTGRTWQYLVDAEFPDAVIDDMTALDQHRFVLIERDDAQGADARQKKVYPSSDGRWIARDRPDDTELIVIRAPALR